VEPDFDAVLAAARAGEEWAVAVLYRELHPRLARYLRARASHVADDLEGEVWLAIATRLHRFEGDEVAFRAWGFSIARRRLADHRRRAARRRTDVVPAEELDRADHLADPAGVVLDQLAGDEAAAFVTRVLPPEQAEVVLLRVVAGLDVEQVAALLGKRPGTIRVMQHRGLKRLEKVLVRLRVTP
jgi:RNA polymerase sigma-70 factor (ECF subfamily)